jgi:hypothetical protein
VSPDWNLMLVCVVAIALAAAYVMTRRRKP